MGLPATTPMLTNREIKVLHVEPTDVCQAACPLCARETDAEFDKHARHHLTFDQIVSVFNQHKIAQLDKMFMCGNYGDPAAGLHTQTIFKKFQQLNPTITLGMNTNGALQNTQWWKDLAKILSGSMDYVVFSIDGLEDTNHIYRKNVVWGKLIENVKSFIDAGGSAHWDMLVYEHNQHQVDLSIELARQLGFTWFRAKVSKRPIVGNLRYPINWQRSTINVGNIECMAIKDHSMYIDCRGVGHPCCWQHTVSLSSDIDLLEQSWTSDSPNNICKSTCTQTTNLNNFTNQWKLELQLK
jgi:sulfatase maturation enzyme AslB (radical SAM superfamily)